MSRSLSLYVSLTLTLSLPLSLAAKLHTATGQFVKQNAIYETRVVSYFTNRGALVTQLLVLPGMQARSIAAPRLANAAPK